MKIFILTFVFFALNALAQEHHFFDISREENSWRVHHFRAEPGKLQEHVSSRTFFSEAQALQYRDKLSRTFPVQKSFSYVIREHGAAPLWNVTNAWNQDWERKYSEWISKEFDADFFVRGNLATDCADVAYALRWIYSRNNGLPAAATLAGSGAIASHLSAKKEWENLPGHKDWHKDQKFMAALQWLLSNVYTKTLYLDGYPVTLDRESITPGLINLLGGHTEIFSQVSYESGEVPFQLLSSTVPQAVRTLAGRIFFDSYLTEQRSGGLFKYRWAIVKDSGVSMIPKEEMWNYSLEQYRQDLCPDEDRFGFCLLQKLEMNFDPKLIADRMIGDIKAALDQRVQIVRDGFAYCQTNDCSPGTDGFENWSTPSRDGRLKKFIFTTSSTLHTIGGHQRFEDWKKSNFIEIPAKLRVSDFIDRLGADFVSSDPRADIEQRWAYDEAAIERGLYGLLKETDRQRELLITAAASCRKAPKACQKDPKKFRELTTVELDKRLSDAIGAWLSYSKDLELRPSKELEKIFLNLFGRSPAPWDPLERRYSGLQGKPHILSASRVEIANSRFLILNHNELYDVTTRKNVEFDFPLMRIMYDSVTSSFIIISELNLIVLDDSLTERGRFPLHQLNSSLDKFFHLGNGTYLIGEYGPGETRFGWTLDLKTLKASEKYPYSYAVTSPGAALLTGGRNSVSFQENSGKVSQAFLPRWTHFSQILSVTSPHQYFYTQYHDDGYMILGAFKEQGSERLMTFSYGGLESWTSHFGYLTDHNEKSWLIHRKTGELAPFTGELAARLPNGEVIINDWDKEKILITDGPELRKFPIPKGKFIQSGGPDWLTDYEGGVYDFSGKILHRDAAFHHFGCSLLATNICKGDDRRILQKVYRAEEGTPFSFAMVGLRDQFEISSVYVYLPVSSDIEEDIEINGAGRREKNISGTVISVGASMHLYFP